MIKNLIIIVFSLFFFTEELYSQDFIKKYFSKNCKGVKSICEDKFVFNISLKKNIENKIIIENSNILEHKHVEKISEYIFKNKDNIFYINFYVINNLENRFDFEVIGQINKNSFLAKKILITYENQFLAEYELEQLK